MKIALSSDWHGHLPSHTLFDGSEGLILAGDIGPDDGRLWFQHEFYKWATKYDRPIWLTWGNHDFVGQHVLYDPVSALGLPSNVQILVDEWTMIEDSLVWFSPWSPIFGKWAWMDSEDNLDCRYVKIPLGTNVVVSHSPPYGYCDFTHNWGDKNVGSKSLRYWLAQLPNLRYVVCGHIHEGYGIAKSDNKSDGGQYQILNVSHCDLDYNPVNAPMFIDI